jgi:PAS domain S-box-containing protein
VHEDYLFQLLDYLPEPRLILDTEGTILKSNKLAVELLGKGKVRLEGTALALLPSLANSPDWVASCRRAVVRAAAGETAVFRASYLTASHGHKDLEFSLIPIPAMDDKRKCLLAIVRDVTEHEKLLREMSKDRQLMTTLLNSAPLFIVALDHQAKILLMNEPMLRSLGYSSFDELRGKDYLSVVVPPEEREQVGSLLARAFNSDKSAGSYTDILIRKVAGRLIEWHLSFVRNGTDEEEFALVVGVDVTRRLEAEKLAEEHKLRLAQAVRLISLGTIITGFAHELNNPNSFIRLNAKNLSSFWSELAGIMDKVASSSTGLTLKGIPYEKARELIHKMIDGIIHGSNRIARIVADVKVFATHGQAKIEGRADVNSAIAASLRILADLIERSTDRFSVEYGRDLPLVSGESQILEIVIGNIVSNACQALTNKQQGIFVSSTRESDGWVAVRVVDEGEGISPDNLEHVFDPFFTTKHDRGGLGIGLSVCRDILTRLGGTISCHSALSKGTEILVRLPPFEVHG